jgi:hypothetical protein
VGTDGRDYCEVFTAEGSGQQIDHIAWDQKGSGLLIARKRRGGVWEILRISADGGTPEVTRFDVKNAGELSNISLSPDGAQLAFSAAHFVRQLWAVDNLVAMLK